MWLFVVGAPKQLGPADGNLYVRVDVGAISSGSGKDQMLGSAGGVGPKCIDGGSAKLCHGRIVDRLRLAAVEGEWQSLGADGLVLLLRSMGR